MRKTQTSSKRKNRLLFLLYVGLFGAIGVGWGYLIGRYAIRHNSQFEGKYAGLKETANVLLNEMKEENIRAHLEYLTNKSHLAGTLGDKTTAEYMANEWRKQGLDDIQMHDYDVYLDYPDEKKINNIQIKDSMNELEKFYEIVEEEFEANIDFSQITKPFLAYSLNGSVSTNEIYYANYCLDDDFDQLARQGFNLTEKIVICRYGFAFRGNKVRNGENRGVKGVLLYEDPIRAAPQNQSNQIYPNGELLPKTGTQRGSIYLGDGDPLTPIYPSIDSAYRIDPNESEQLPKIVAQVIGYELAQVIFDLMDSDQLVPNEWVGGMSVRYVYGGKLKNNRTLTLNVFNEKKISKIYNVMGFIKGSIEPDRYVMIGNHRDSWTFGSLDPSMGTSILLEISRVLAKLKAEKIWEPRRSLIFLSWSAEEYGLIGSTEWVQEFYKKLSANSVVYLNLDFGVYGNFSYEAKASPLLFDLIYQVTSSIKYNENLTVFDQWLKNDPDMIANLPKINPYMGSNSDHMAFLQLAGVPCVDQKFGRSKKSYLNSQMGSTYPAYHTSYETFKLVDSFIDPGFKTSKLLGVVVAELARAVSTPLILPFNTTTYGILLNAEYSKFKNKFQTFLESIRVNLNGLDCAVSNFSIVSHNFMKKVDSIKKHEEHFKIRQINEQFRNLERAFLDYPTNSLHVIFAPSKKNKYSSNFLPAVHDAIVEYQEKKSSPPLVAINKIKLEISLAIYYINSASSILKDPTDFTRFVKN